MIHFATTHVSWRKYKGTNEFGIEGKYLNSIHLKYIEKGIYKEINDKLIEIYLRKNKCAKLKFQSIDSSFIPNKGGIYKTKNVSNKEYNNQNILKQVPIEELLKEYSMEDLITNNGYNGRKKYTKLSHLVDSNGAVLSTYLFSGKVVIINP